MSEQLVYIGSQIEALSRVVLKTPFGENTFEPEKGQLFNRVAKLFINRCEGNEKCLISFADDFGRKLIHSRVPLDESIEFVYQTRSSIMGLLEREFRENVISVDTFFEAIRLLEYVYQLISKTFLDRYSEELTFTQFALNESHVDLQITLRELADLRKVLNEATIFSITDRDDRITYVNDHFCNLYQYTREELMGKNHYLFFSDFHPPSFFQAILETLKRGEAWKGEILNQTKDGSKVWLDTTLVPFVDVNGEHYQHISIQYDITEKKKTEATLRKTEQLSMIGELAAGIAHEIRNPLTTVRGFVQLLTENGQGQDYAGIILEEIERINFIVNEFMVFAKPHTIYFSDCNLKDILYSVIKFLEPEALLKNVVITKTFPSEEIVLSGEKNQLRQVFLNLLKNAMEAMPSGGTIDVSIEKESSGSIVMTIRDEGTGMGEEQIKRLGEPFFTTKQAGNGLGLMVSYKIIQNHKGTIEVKSELHQGTAFIITFK